MKKLLFIILVWFSFGQIASANTSAIPGKTYQYNSKDYRLLIDVKNFYKFTRLAKSSTKVVMENKAVIVEMKINGYECLMNDVKLYFDLAIYLMEEPFGLWSLIQDMVGEIQGL